MATLLYHLLEGIEGRGPLLESLKSHTLVTLTAYAQNQSWFCYIFSLKGLIQGGTGPPLNSRKCFWDGTSFNGKVTLVQVLLEPVCAGPGGQVHLSVWSDGCGGWCGQNRPASQPWGLPGETVCDGQVLAEVGSLTSPANTGLEHTSHLVSQMHHVPRHVLFRTPWQGSLSVLAWAVFTWAQLACTRPVWLGA